MARVWICGFETGDLSELGGTNSGVTTIQSTQTRSGNYAALINNALAYRESKTGFNLTTGFYRLCVRPSAYPATVNTALGGFDSSTDATLAFLAIDPTGKIQCRDLTTGTELLLGTSAAAIPLNSWSVLELKLVIAAAGAGSIEFRVNGVVEGTFTGRTTNARGNIDRVDFATTTVVTPGAVYFDDLAVDDAVYPGAGKIIARQPIVGGTPTYNQYTKSTGTDAGALWDNTPFTTADACTDATNAHAQTAQIEVFTTPQTGHGSEAIAAGDTIQACKAWLVGKTSTVASSGALASIRRRVNSVDTDTAITLTTADVYYETPPFTASVADLNIVQIGAVHGNSTATHTIEDVGLLVEYLPAAGSIGAAAGIGTAAAIGRAIFNATGAAAGTGTASGIAFELLGAVYLDPAMRGPTITLSNANLAATQSAAATGNARAIAHHANGDYYHEFTVNVAGDMQVGLCNGDLPLTEYLGQDSLHSIGVDDGGGWLGAGGTTTAPALIVGHTYGMATHLVDGAGAAWLKDITAAGNWNADATADPVTGVNGATFFVATTSALLKDDFSRYADGATLNGALPLIGPAWGTTGTSIPQISGGFLVNAGSGYLYDILPSAPTTMTADVSWISSGAGQLTLAFAGNNVPFSLNDLIHLIFSYANFTLTTRLGGGSFVTIMSGNWATPMVLDGRLYHVELTVSGDTAAVKGPSGEYFTSVHSSVSDSYGKALYYQAATEGRIAKVEANATVMPADLGTWLDPVSAHSMTLSNSNKTATGSGAAARTARSLASRSTGKAQVEFVLNVHAAPTSDNNAVGFGSTEQWPNTIDVGGDLKSLAIYPRGANTGIWSGNTYKVTGYNISGAAGTRVCMRVNFDAKTVTFKDVTNGGAFTSPYDWSAAISGAAPYSVAICLGGATDATTVYMREAEMVTPLDNDYEPWQSAGYIAPLGRIAGSSLAYALGDSRTQQNRENVTSYSARGSGAAYAKRLSLGRLQLPILNVNGGPGETSAQIRSGRYPSAKASAAKILLLLTGVNQGASMAQDLADVTFMAQDFAASASDRVVFVWDEMPVDTAAGWDATAKARHASLRDGIRLLHSPSSGVYVVPSWRAATGGNDSDTPLAGFFAAVDGIHPTVPGGYLLGKMLNDYIAPLIPAFDPYAGKTFATGTAMGGANFAGTTGDALSVAGLNPLGAVSSRMVVDGSITWAELTVNTSGAPSINPSAATLPSNVTPGVTTVSSILKVKLHAGVSHICGIQLHQLKQSGAQLIASNVWDYQHQGVIYEIGALPTTSDVVFTLQTPPGLVAADATQARWQVLFLSEDIGTVDQVMVGKVSVAYGGMIIES